MHWGKQNIFIQFVRGGDHPHIHLRHVYMNFSYEKHNQEDSGGVEDKNIEKIEDTLTFAQNIFIQFVRGGDHPHIQLWHVYMNFSYEKHNQEDSGGVQDKQPEQNISYFWGGPEFENTTD